MFWSFKAKQSLFITIDGSLRVSYRSTVGDENKINDYWKMVTFIIRQAAKEQRWTIEEDEPVYICVILYQKAVGTNKQMVQDLIDGKITKPFKHGIFSFTRRLLLALIGSVIKSEKQISAFQIIREFDEEPRAEIVIGKPDSLEEIKHDLSRAE